MPIWTILYASTLAFSGFNPESYLKKCGGTYYPSCDSKELNQLTIFEDAQREARAAKKSLLVIIGADWCAPCRELHRLMARNSEELATIESKYLIVRLAASTDKVDRLQSIHAVEGKMNVKIDSFPWLYVFDPVSSKTVRNFSGGELSLYSLKNQLGVK